MFNVIKIGETAREREMFRLVGEQYERVLPVLEKLLKEKRSCGKTIRYNVLLSNINVDDALETARDSRGDDYWDSFSVTNIPAAFGFDLQAALLKYYKENGDIKVFNWVKDSVIEFFNNVKEIISGGIYKSNAADCLHRALFFMNYDSCFAESPEGIGENGYNMEITIDIIDCLEWLCSFGMFDAEDVSSQFRISLALIYAAAYFEQSAENSKVLFDAGIAAARALANYYTEVGSEEQRNEARSRLREIEDFIKMNGLGARSEAGGFSAVNKEVCA